MNCINAKKARAEAIIQSEVSTGINRFVSNAGKFFQMCNFFLLTRLRQRKFKAYRA
jgi:hypothetical protein